METHPHRGEHLFPLLHGTQLVQLYAAQLVPPGVALGGVGAVMAMPVTILSISGFVLGPGMIRLVFPGNLIGFVRNPIKSGVLLCIQYCKDSCYLICL